MLSTKDLYMKACMQSKELHAMTYEERSRFCRSIYGKCTLK